ncbi:MAG: urea amidolyase [Rhodobacteraceae bacterium]|nr:urea amidolyase [Paracoccaceae bacterium]
MTALLTLHKAGPGITVQDGGRPGMARLGLSRGGAVDRLALLEAAALLKAEAPLAALEMAGIGGVFTTTAAARIALTGAPMRADIDGRELAWGASHLLLPDQTLTIGPALSGRYGYLTPEGGVGAPSLMSSVSAHLAAGLGRACRSGDRFVIARTGATDAGPETMTQAPRFAGGVIRYVAGPQSALFSDETRKRFRATEFRVSGAANRQGVRLDHDGAPFAAEPRAGLVSEPIIEGDIQMTGEGQAAILLAECQTIGGYPRIGTVLPADLPIVAQAPTASALRFREVSFEEADRLLRTEPSQIADLRRGLRPLVRDPRKIPDLLNYQLISGVTAGDAPGER